MQGTCTLYFPLSLIHTVSLYTCSFATTRHLLHSRTKCVMSVWPRFDVVDHKVASFSKRNHSRFYVNSIESHQDSLTFWIIGIQFTFGTLSKTRVLLTKIATCLSPIDTYKHPPISTAYESAPMSVVSCRWSVFRSMHSNCDTSYIRFCARQRCW